MWYAVRIAAAPGSGNAAFTAATQSKIANRFHFVYKADLVPCLPTYVGYPEPQPYRCVRANRRLSIRCSAKPMVPYAAATAA
jgi:hypothetical protein